jgi:L-fuculose-phosphate aldolase
MSSAIRHQSLREEIIRTALEMNARGINQGTSGNVSARVEDGFLITPSGMPYEDLRPEDIVEMAWDASYVGPRPSSEWRFHRDILRSRPDVEAIVHTHSCFATTLAIHKVDIPACHYMVAMAGGPTVRCADYATFGTQELSDNALRALEGRLACLLAHHGVIALGKTLRKALGLAVEVENLARMYIHAQALGKPPVLPDEEMARVMEQMRRMSYGQAPDRDGAADTPRPRAPAG